MNAFNTVTKRETMKLFYIYCFTFGAEQSVNKGPIWSMDPEFDTWSLWTCFSRQNLLL